jgi:hypothetical protein
MQLIRKSEFSRMLAIVVGLAAAMFMLFGVGFSTAHAALTTAQIDSIVSLLQSFGADAGVVANVKTTLEGGTPSGPPSSGGSCSYTFGTSYSTGASAPGVMDVQSFLNMDPATQVAASGVGSPGNETQYFGSLTAAAVTKFQNKYASDVLTPVGLSAGTGYWGPSSRAKAQSLCDAMTGGPVTPGPGPVTPPGSGVSISAGVQPVASLAPDGAARVPYTNFTVTASNDGPVTINSVVVERSGLVNKSVFSGIVLLDSAGMQLGNSKTLNSNYQATIGDSVTVPAGQSRTFTVAGNMAADLSARAGEVGGLNVVAINTSSSVSGSLPISGAAHTINSTLAIGTVTLNVSSFDPNTAQTKEIGTTDVRFAGIRVTAGSSEDVRVRSMRWNQVGSASFGDFANLVMVADGVNYPVTVSANGNYFSAVFGNGIVIPKGNNIDIYIKGDIIDGTNRTVVFDIEKTTDFYATGELYGYGLTPTAGATGAEATNTATFSTDGSPFFDGSQTTINAGTATSIGKSSSVPAQNISVNVPNQPLGAFKTNFKGEAVQVSGITLSIASTTGSGYGLLTSVTIVDSNGSVVSGPTDATYTSALVQTVTMTDTVTFPTGEAVYTVQGKVDANIGNNGTYIVTVTPSGWTTPVGDTTGDSVSLSAFGAFTLNTMTVKAAALTVTLSSDPVAQNIVSGIQGFTYGKYQLDASQSGEDVRFSSMVADLESSGSFAGAPSNLTSCQMFDGTTPLNTGSNVVNPSTTATTSDDANTFTFDNSLTVAKGTVKTLSLKCNLSSSADSGSTYQWGVRNTAANMVVTGVTSSNTVTETVTASNGQVMTVATGTLVASEDSESPPYQVVSAGSTGVNNGIINFRASNEDVTLQRIGLSLTNTASSSGTDLVQVTLWDGATKVGSAVFTGTNTKATSTLTTPVLIPKDTDKDITVKIDLANIGTSAVGTQGALIAVDVEVNTNTRGVGESGTTINATGSTSMNGVRVFKSFPTIAKLSVPSTTLINGVSDLYRFSITSSAGGNGIGLHQLTLNLSTSTGNAVSGTTTVTLVDVYAYTDANFSTPVAAFTNGKIITQLAGLASSGDNDLQLSSILQIPAGKTYYFKVSGTVTLTAGTGTFSGSVTSRLGGDSTYPTLAAVMGLQSAVDGNANGDNMVWSPNATTSSLSTHVDWSNGFNIPGLPSSGTDAVTLSK